VGSYSMAEADNLRRAMSKKKVSEMEEEKPKFLEGAKKNKVPKARAETIWKQMETFAGYGFNKSHSTAYAVISYQTAYLKAHYPVEFMASLLTSEKNNRDNIIKYINECKDMGISVLPPDINESLRDFSVSGNNNIRFGLAAVKNVGESAVDSIIESRGRGDNFLSFYDYCDRVDLRRANKKVLESLIKCGAFDSLETNRHRLMEGYDTIVEVAQKRSRDRESGQMSIFGQSSTSIDVTEPTLPDVAEWDRDDILSYEKEMLGFYITGHPLLKYEDTIKLVVDTYSTDLINKRDESTVSVAGVTSSVREVMTKKKETMAYIQLDDMKGLMSVIVFPDLYHSSLFTINSDEPIFIKGKIDAGDEDCKIIATEISSLEDALENPFTSLHFTIPLNTSDPSDIEGIKAILESNKGNYPSFIHLYSESNIDTVIYLGDNHRVSISDDIKKGVDAIFGQGTTYFV
jgi:DNA polymerase-3 subunit alpha